MTEHIGEIGPPLVHLMGKRPGEYWEREPEPIIDPIKAILVAERATHITRGSHGWRKQDGRKRVNGRVVHAKTCGHCGQPFETTNEKVRGCTTRCGRRIAEAEREQRAAEATRRPEAPLPP